MYNEGIKAVIKELDGVRSYGHSSHRVFDDFLEIMISSLTGNEEKYMKTIEPYTKGEKGKRAIDYYCRAFSQLLMAGNQTGDEILGEIYMQWNISNKYAGQFFTPSNIADLMASILGKVDSGSIYDPTCGAGIMLVAKAKQMTPVQLSESIFYGQDLDHTCVMMCALNMAFFNLNSYVICGNTLTMENYSGYATRRTAIGGEIRELTKEEVESCNRQIEEKGVLYRSGTHADFALYVGPR